jgi:hypothetical protein
VLRGRPGGHRRRCRRRHRRLARDRLRGCTGGRRRPDAVPPQAGKLLTRLRALLVGLIVAATAAFIVGTTIERNSGDKHTEKSSAAKAVAQTGEGGSHKEGGAQSPDAHSESGGETGQAHKEGNSESAGGGSAHRETHQELKPLGVDIEAAPFVALAAVASLVLALGAWLRPRWLLLLLVIAAAMLVFAALDVREVFHQSDESRTGLAILAAFVALLHLGAAAVGGVMGREARRAPA